MTISLFSEFLALPPVNAVTGLYLTSMLPSRAGSALLFLPYVTVPQYISPSINVPDAPDEKILSPLPILT